MRFPAQAIGALLTDESVAYTLDGGGPRQGSPKPTPVKQFGVEAELANGSLPGQRAFIPVKPKLKRSSGGMGGRVYRARWCKNGDDLNHRTMNPLHGLYPVNEPSFQSNRN